MSASAESSSSMAIDKKENESDSEEEIIILDLPKMKLELMQKTKECQERGLAHSYKWLSEIRYSIRNVNIGSHSPSKISNNYDVDEDNELYDMAKSYFDLKEYDRCAFFTKSSKSPKTVFLHYYSKYLAGEKRRIDNQTDTMMSNDLANLSYLKELRSDLQKLCTDEAKIDGYILYLYGIILKKLGLNTEAKTVLQECLQKEPCLWSAWQELAYFINDRATLSKLKFPDHWTKHFFLAHCYLELLLNDPAIDIYSSLQNCGLKDFSYIMAQLAIAYHNKRELDQAVECFKELTNEDPFRLDNLDTYSNVLYVRDQRVELAHLAHHTVQIDKYRPETCCVIGNYYSLRSQHAKAAQYFQRALKLNPNNLSAWTLLGHEFMELKNKSAAIQSYRQAIEVNPRDYRAWYGLGQTYEILKMHSYCLYYYKKAQELRPNDSRMLMALGVSYEKLNKLQDALKCFWKAHLLGDVERTVALYQLAKLYERSEDGDQAAAAYHQFILDSENEGLTDDRDQLSKAYRYLAYYHNKKGQNDDAYHFAQKCTEFADTREDGKALLKEIMSRGGINDDLSLLTTPAPLMAPLGPMGPIDRGLERVLRENNGSFASPQDSDSGSAADQGGDFVPMNLSFTP